MAGGQRGAHSAFDDDRRRRGFPWWLLALLAIALIALVLLLRACGDDDEDTEPSATTTPPAQTTPATTPPDDATTGGGTLTARGEDLLPTEAGQQLDQYVGEQAQGQRVRVQEVVPEEGFFVGTSEDDRVYVEFGGDVGETESGSESYEPAEGDVVNLAGPVRPSPEDPEQTLNLDRDDAQQVREQGIYINAEDVQPAS
jgi:hypothetical protein